MCDEDERIEAIKRHIRGYPDFPKKGILFRDVFSALLDPQVLRDLKEVLVNTARRISPPVECIVGLDSRGFLFGPLISLELNVPFVPVRKKGKLPGEVVSISYKLEYGEDTLEIQKDAIGKGKRVLIVDDLLATGGTLGAACQLVEKIGGDVVACLLVMELEKLKGKKKVPAKIISLIKY